MCSIVLKVLQRYSVVLPLMALLISSAVGQEETPTVRVSAGILPPFVIKDGDQLTGFSIDLWNEIAARLKVKTTYHVVGDIDSLLESLRAKNADTVVPQVPYTTELDKEFDFSYPTLEAGLQVMVRDQRGDAIPTPLKDVFALLFSWSAVIWLGVALLIVIVPAHVIWLLDRGNDDGASPSKSYLPGIFQALSWATTALVSQVQTLPRRWTAQLFGILWMFAGVVFIALYTAQLTATLTVGQIRGAINGPDDLPGKQVATLAHSAAIPYLQEIGADVQVSETSDEMYQALLSDKVDAILLGAPPLQYYAAHGGSGRAKMVGAEFDRQTAGFVFQLGDPLRRRVSSILLGLREDGTYQQIYEKWFGDQ